MISGVELAMLVFVMLADVLESCLPNCRTRWSMYKSFLSAISQRMDGVIGVKYGLGMNVIANRTVFPELRFLVGMVG